MALFCVGQSDDCRLCFRYDYHLYDEAQAAVRHGSSAGDVLYVCDNELYFECGNRFSPAMDYELYSGRDFNACICLRRCLLWPEERASLRFVALYANQLACFGMDKCRSVVIMGVR